MKRVKNWKSVYASIDIQGALNVLKTQTFEIGASTFNGPFAIKSKVSGKIYTAYDPDLKLSSAEVVGLWELLMPDTDEEEKTNKIIQLAKDSNCTGLSYERLDNMTINDIWLHLCTFVFTQKTKYRIIKWFFENKVYKDK